MKAKRTWKSLFIVLIATLALAISTACGSILSSKPADDNTQTEQPNGGNGGMEQIYTVTFMADGIVCATRTYTEQNKSITVPDVPEKEGYTGKWENYILNMGNITIDAIYTPIEYTVTFVASGVTQATVKYTIENQEITPPPVPEKAGYTGKWTNYTVTTGDKTVLAVYTPIEYTVTFMAEGKAQGTQTYTVENKDITEPSVPTKVGYTSKWESYTLDLGDKTVNAVYELDEALKPFEFTVTGNDYEITKVKDENVTELLVPEYATLSFGVLEYCTKLTKLTLNLRGQRLGYYFGANDSNDYDIYVPSSLKTVILMGDTYYNFIPWLAFYNCEYVTSVVISDGMTSIGSEAFEYCSSLTSVEIPDSVTSIGESAFYYCSSLTNIVIPDSMTSIGSEAFSRCSSLKNIVIPDSVTSIGSSAFSECSSLTSVEIPNSVTSIDSYAFEDCSSLTKVYYEGNLEQWMAIGKSYCFSTGFDLYCNNALVTEVAISEGTKKIAEYQFAYCKSIKKVTIPNSVKKIEGSAFYYCSSLTSVVIPDSVMSIGQGAFYNCDSLTSVEIGDGVTSIGSWAFSGCSSLTSVTFENPNGWSAGGTALSSTDLSNTSTATTYLKSYYVNYDWTRKD